MLGALIWGNAVLNFANFTQHLCVFIIVFRRFSLLFVFIILNSLRSVPMENGKLFRAFIQALLSTAVFPQSFSFFTVCLVHYHCKVPPWWALKGKFLKFRSPGCRKMYFHSSLEVFIIFFTCGFSLNFVVLWEVSKKGWVGGQYIQLCFCFPVCVFLSIKTKE